jgi:anthranilate phosphoribosyltransferase
MTDGAPEPAPAPTWPDVLTALTAGEDLDTARAEWAMGEIFAGNASPIVVGAFLVALRAKGETVTELKALADVMLEHANRIEVPGDTLDIVGTGGDRAHTVNISTMSAIVAAGAGRVVVKHGNRAASSSSGSADVLEALGVDLTIAPERVAEVAREAGITFCFAQAFHPSMRHAAPARAALGIGTAFNVLGPLTNPGQPRHAAIGVADARIAPLIAGVFAERGRPAAVFRGDDGLDELTIATTSRLWWVRDGRVSELTVAPEDFGLAAAPLSSIRGADAAHNAGVARSLVAGERGPVRDAVLLNAGTALAVGQAAHDEQAVREAIGAGIEQAAASIDSGAAGEALERWVAATRA